MAPDRLVSAPPARIGMGAAACEMGVTGSALTIDGGFTAR